jgi:hypothetical protein
VYVYAPEDSVEARDADTDGEGEIIFSAAFTPGKEDEKGGGTAFTPGKEDEKGVGGAFTPGKDDEKAGFSLGALETGAAGAEAIKLRVGAPIFAFRSFL